MRIPKGQGFSLPVQIFDDEMPDVAFRLLCYLYSVSSCVGRCTIGYHAMMHGIAASQDSIWRSFTVLRKKGWIYSVKRNGSRPSTFLLRVPPRLHGMHIQLKPGKLIVLEN